MLLPGCLGPSGWREAAAPACGRAAGARSNSTWMETLLPYSEMRMSYTGYTQPCQLLKRLS